MALTPSAKIAIGWSVIITVGLYSFVAARNSVVKNRKSIMDVKRRIQEQAQEEGTAEFKRKAELKQIRRESWREEEAEGAETKREDSGHFDIMA